MPRCCMRDESQAAQASMTPCSEDRWHQRFREQASDTGNLVSMLKQIRLINVDQALALVTHAHSKLMGPHCTHTSSHEPSTRQHHQHQCIERWQIKQISVAARQQQNGVEKYVLAGHTRLVEDCTNSSTPRAGTALTHKHACPEP